MSWIGFYTLTKREVIRFFKVPAQAILPPIVSAVLFILIFGYALGDRLGDLIQVPYKHFLVPGLIMMGLISNAYQNTSSSLYISRFINHIEEILVTPISYMEMVIAYSIGGIARGIIVGVGTYLAALFFVDLPLHNVWLVLYFLLFVSSIFASIGLILGLWSETFDQMAIPITFVITPLIFFGGVFHSINAVPEFLRFITVFNPIFYMVDGLRYGFLGIQDGNIFISMVIVFVLAIVLFLFTVHLFKIGYKLRK